MTTLVTTGRGRTGSRANHLRTCRITISHHHHTAHTPPAADAPAHTVVVATATTPTTQPPTFDEPAAQGHHQPPCGFQPPHAPSSPSSGHCRCCAQQHAARRMPAPGRATTHASASQRRNTAQHNQADTSTRARTTAAQHHANHDHTSPELCNQTSPACGPPQPSHHDHTPRVTTTPARTQPPWPRRLSLDWDMSPRARHFTTTGRSSAPHRSMTCTRSPCCQPPYRVSASDIRHAHNPFPNTMRHAQSPRYALEYSARRQQRQAAAFTKYRCCATHHALPSAHSLRDPIPDRRAGEPTAACLLAPASHSMPRNRPPPTAIAARSGIR